MKQFNTFSGVFVPSFEAILGAVLFLILPMLTGVMGLWKMLAIVVFSNTVTLATAFSIADSATNIERIGAGGMYAVSRRSLGRAFGGSIGIQLFLAQTASIGFYAIGFAEPLQEILQRVAFINSAIGSFDPLVQKQIIATFIALIAFLTGIAGANFIVKIQMVIFVVLIVSVGSIFIAPALNLTSNNLPLFSGSVNLRGSGLSMGFWAAFAAFFPAVTGIDAGVGMSGSLKDPKSSLPKGTFMAIGITALVYIGITVVYSLIQPELLSTSEGGQIPTASTIFAQAPFIPYLILTGILVATGSSALSYFMTAPRTAQAMAKDRILPRLFNFLKRDFSRKGKEPRWATVLTFLIILPVIWSGDVTQASMVVGICFLVVYGWVNLAGFLERISGNPSFRPTSRGHWSISLYGFVTCMVAISFFNVWVGVGVIVSQMLIFMLLFKYKSQNKLEGVWWGVLFSVMNWGFHRMKKIVQGTKNWRPIMNIFCFADKLEESEQTIKMGERIANYQGLIMYNILRSQRDAELEFEAPFGSKIIEVPGGNFDNAILSIVQASIPGGLRINTILLPVDARLNHIEIIEEMINLENNVLLYSHGEVTSKDANMIDVWWKGEENGNLMALLAYIINRTDIKQREAPNKIRIIRKISESDNREESLEEMQIMLEKARLTGEVLIIPEDKKPIHETIKEYSQDALLVIMGMPGERKGGIARLFFLDQLFFKRELGKFTELPPLLFVKASRKLNLVED